MANNDEAKRRRGFRRKRPEDEMPADQQGFQAGLDAMPGYMHYGISRRMKIDGLRERIRADEADLREHQQIIADLEADNEDGYNTSEIRKLQDMIAGWPSDIEAMKAELAIAERSK